MHPSYPSGAKYTRRAKVAIGFLVASVALDVAMLRLITDARHAPSMEGFGDYVVALALGGLAAVASFLGGLACSSDRWRGPGERTVAILCVLAFAVPIVAAVVAMP